MVARKPRKKGSSIPLSTPEALRVVAELARRVRADNKPHLPIPVASLTEDQEGAICGMLKEAPCFTHNRDAVLDILNRAVEISLPHRVAIAGRPSQKTNAGLLRMVEVAAELYASTLERVRASGYDNPLEKAARASIDHPSPFNDNSIAGPILGRTRMRLSVQGATLMREWAVAARAALPSDVGRPRNEARGVLVREVVNAWELAMGKAARRTQNKGPTPGPLVTYVLGLARPSATPAVQAEEARKALDQELRRRSRTR